MEERGSLGLQICFSRQCFKIARLGLEFRDQIIRQLFLGIGDPLFFEVGDDRALHLVKSLKVRGLFILQLDDVDSVNRLDEAAHLSGLHRERLVLEFLHGLSPHYPSQLPALRG